MLQLSFTIIKYFMVTAPLYFFINYTAIKNTQWKLKIIEVWDFLNMTLFSTVSHITRWSNNSNRIPLSLPEWNASWRVKMTKFLSVCRWHPLGCSARRFQLSATTNWFLIIAASSSLHYARHLAYASSAGYEASGSSPFRMESNIGWNLAESSARLIPML